MIGVGFVGIILGAAAGWWVGARWYAPVYEVRDSFIPDPPPGSFQMILAAPHDGGIWRLNTRSGQVSICAVDAPSHLLACGGPAEERKYQATPR